MTGVVPVEASTPAEWEVLPFTDVFDDASAGHPKTFARDFLTSGAFPLIDQGQKAIGGYTNDASMLCSAELPVIVFGDHTRALKFVDFPFGIGADGVKILRPKVNADAKYLYRYLQWVGIDAAGYDRHFKYLKRINIQLPPIDEQRRIAAVLDRADELRAKRRTALALLDTLAESVFVDMFGRESRDDAPRGALSQLGRVVTGKTPPTTRSGMFGGPVPFITPGDLTGGVIAASARSLTAAGGSESRLVSKGATLVCCIGTIGKVGMTDRDSAFNQQINAVEWGPRILPDYGLYSLKLLRSTIRSMGASTTVPLLNKTSFSRLEIRVPSLDSQIRFQEAIAAIRPNLDRDISQQSELNDLFASLQHSAFRGEL